MFKMLTNLTKAAVAVVATPVAAVVDVVKLPATSYNDEHPFANSKKCLEQAGKAFDEAVKPEQEEE